MAQITATTPMSTTATIREALTRTGRVSPFVEGAVARLVDIAATAGLLTEAQRTPVLDEGLGAYRTTPIETGLRDFDADGGWDPNPQRPWLAAEIVVHTDKPQAYGRKTQVWLDYGLTTGELTPAKAREALAAMKEFTARYEALLDVADEIAAADFDGDPEIARLDREAEDRRIKARTAELLAAEGRA